MSATTMLESMPPDRRAPMGTSATIRAPTESESAASTRSVASRSSTSAGCASAASMAASADQ